MISYQITSFLSWFTTVHLLHFCCVWTRSFEHMYLYMRNFKNQSQISLDKIPIRVKKYIFPPSKPSILMQHWKPFSTFCLSPRLSICFFSCLRRDFGSKFQTKQIHRIAAHHEQNIDKGNFLQIFWWNDYFATACLPCLCVCLLLLATFLLLGMSTRWPTASRKTSQNLKNALLPPRSSVRLLSRSQVTCSFFVN